MTARIGVAVSTCERPVMQTLPNALRIWQRFLPDDAEFVVIDADRDASRVSSGDARVIHMVGRMGVAATKNAGLAHLMAAGCDHMWLVDDDVWPVVPGWWKPYLTADQPHLSLSWGRARRIGRDGPYTVWRWPRGVALYVEARVVETVGGMRTEFDRAGGGEHVEWSRRIHNAGLTRWPFADLTRARDWWHAEDWGRQGETNDHLSVRRADNTTIDRASMTQVRHALYEKYRGSRDFVPYLAS